VIVKRASASFNPTLLPNFKVASSSFFIHAQLHPSAIHHKPSTNHINLIHHTQTTFKSRRNGPKNRIQGTFPRTPAQTRLKLTPYSSDPNHSRQGSSRQGAS
jgi:hypothetical protein